MCRNIPLIQLPEKWSLTADTVVHPHFWMVKVDPTKGLKHPQIHRYTALRAEYRTTNLQRFPYYSLSWVCKCSTKQFFLSLHVEVVTCQAESSFCFIKHQRFAVRQAELIGSTIRWWPKSTWNCSDVYETICISLVDWDNVRWTQIPVHTVSSTHHLGALLSGDYILFRGQFLLPVCSLIISCERLQACREQRSQTSVGVHMEHTWRTQSTDI